MSQPANHGNSIFATLTMYLVQVKIYHLQTLNYSRHVASGDLYDSMTKHIDRFMELYKARYGPVRFVQPDDRIELMNVTDPMALSHLLLPYIAYLESDLVAGLRASHDSDLLNLRDEMLADANQTRYLFQFEK